MAWGDFDLGCSASRTRRQTSAFSAPGSVVLYYSRPRKLIQILLSPSGNWFSGLDSVAQTEHGIVRSTIPVEWSTRIFPVFALTTPCARKSPRDTGRIAHASSWNGLRCCLDTASNNLDCPGENGFPFPLFHSSNDVQKKGSIWGYMFLTPHYHLLILIFKKLRFKVWARENSMVVPQRGKQKITIWSSSFTPRCRPQKHWIQDLKHIFARPCS